jgi:hypothetical protein
VRNAERPLNGRGRPSKLSDELKKELLQGIETGLTYELACNRVGITYRTFRNWMRKGEAAKSGELFHFFQEVRAAEARGATALLMLIRRSANEGQWQAAKWILERRYREHYGERGVASVEPSGRGGPIRGNLEVDDTAARERAKRFEELFRSLDAARAERADTFGVRPGV